MSTIPENVNTQAEAEGGEPVEEQQQQQHGEDGERSTGGGNRWPREETMALLKIRSEMDGAFKDISPKAPLWEQVSRKLAELGYQRSWKKCKEKFENIYKYHRRTKDGRSARPNAKTYRFFDQLEALDTTHHHHHHHHHIHLNSSSSEGQPPNNAADVIRDAVPCSVFPSSADNNANVSEYNSTSSATSSSSNSKKGDKKNSKRRRRRLTQMFEGLMRQVIEKQESLQRNFMHVLDKCERERMAREQAWKAEELARIQREREILAQERSVSAAKDEAVLTFLKKFAESGGNGTLQLPDIITQLPTIVPQHDEKERDKDIVMQEYVVSGKNNNNRGNNVVEQQYNGNNPINVANFVHMSSSRWPKDEVEALIRLRTQLDVQHNQVNNSSNNGANKGPLWEEVSLAMKSLGYDRSAKRCKEKWENINKYFKRMKEKNKRKPEDSKTCPYYHHLEALYSNKKTKKMDETASSGNDLRPEELLMHIMSGQEDRQQQQQQLESSSEDVADGENNDQNHQGDNNDEEDGYHQMVANSPNSIAIMG